MSNNQSNSPPSTPNVPPRSRRASLATGSSFTELFARPGNAAPPPPPPVNTSTTTNPGAMFTAQAAAQQQQRRMSITSLGLSGSPTAQQSHFGPNTAASAMHRRGSVSSSVLSSSPNVEHAVAEESEGETDTPMTTPTSPFARRVSFGAQALRDRAGSVNGKYPFRTGTSSTGAPPRSPSLNSHNNPHNHYNSGSGSTSSNSNSSSNTSPSSGALSASTASTYKDNSQNIHISNPSWRPIGEGFNWAEALRTRAERAPSIGSFPASTSPTKTMHPGFPHPQGQGQGHGHPASASSPPRNHHRAASVATMEGGTAPAQMPPKEMLERHPSSPPAPQPKQTKPKPRPKPDYFQEKILRADFMD